MVVRKIHGVGILIFFKKENERSIEYMKTPHFYMGICKVSNSQFMELAF